MSSITTMVSNPDEKVTSMKIDSTGFELKELCFKHADINSLKVSKTSIEKLDVSKCEELQEIIAMMGNKLNEAIEAINILKSENEVLKSKNLSTNSNDKYQTIKVGQLTKEEMLRFNLGSYEK
ncbi:hypothetical protein [Clostridium sp. B9]|uniref:hypothetical protein n=1 Tax=Clostridium sp. B9 TaxID=3423224 RepID=UPI003D2F0E20